MNQLLTIPIEFRLAAMFMAGTVLGSLANLAAYRLAWHPRAISPWGPRHPDPHAPPRRWIDRVPIFGWLPMRRESPLHGVGFWIRPLLVELLAGFGLAWLYWWEIEQLGLLPAAVPRAVPAAWMTMLHLQVAVHVLLVWLMLAASLIDVDEKTIPDAITVPGTLVALILAAVVPVALLPDMAIPAGVALPGDFWQRVTPAVWPIMTPSAPQIMPECLAGVPRIGPLALALGCWWLWCFGLMRRDWYGRHGFGRALALMLARLRREPSTPWFAMLGVVGSVAVVAVWFWGGRHWMGLLTAMVGMAVAGGLVWAVRVIGTAVLRREAMGFGDVTLMAMIGAFLGWQASVLVFFLAPLAALVVGLAILVFCRDPEIPYGPFLCIATLVVLVRWASVWNWASPPFALVWLVPAAVVAAPIALGVMLGLWLVVKWCFHKARGMTP